MKISTSLALPFAAAIVALAGVATAQVAQTNPPTATAGNGCTATGNAMRGGSMSAHPSNIPCGAAAAAPAAVITPIESAPAVAVQPPAQPAPVAQAAPAAPMAQEPPVQAAPMRVARADRN